MCWVPFIGLRKFLSIPSCLRFSIIKEHWILLNSLSASVEMFRWFLSCFLHICRNWLLDVRIVNWDCILGINPTCSWCKILLTCSWIQLADIMLTILQLKVYQICGSFWKKPNIYFPWLPLIFFYLLISTLIFIISYLVLTLGFNWSFSGLLRCKIKLVILGVLSQYIFRAINDPLSIL